LILEQALGIHKANLFEAGSYFDEQILSYQ
jgi:hypothetical protein